jgi:hypothetical protein
MALAAFLGVWLGGGTAHGHITLLDPAPRTDQQKEGPCGTTGLPRGETVAVYAPGDTITVMWDETIDHDSHYRIALDVDGDDDFVAPAGDDDLYNSPTVLVDGIGDEAGGGRYTFDVILPDDVECEYCVLQLIQVMYDGGNYFQCADIAIRRGGGGTPPPPADDYDGGGYPDGGPDTGTPPMYEDGGTPPPPAYDSGRYPADGGGDGGAPADDPPTGAAYGTMCAAVDPARSDGPPMWMALFLVALGRRVRKRRRR